MSKKEMLTEYERERLEKIRELGLVHRVEHKQYTKQVCKTKWNNKLKRVTHILVNVPHPQKICIGKGTVIIVGESCVSLYYKNDGIKGRDLDSEAPVGIGYSWCSHKDVFDRQIGRVKALDRAIKSFLNSEASNVKKE